MELYTAAVITISDKGARGEREDTSGPALCKMLENDGWKIAYTTIVPDEASAIRAALTECAKEKSIPLVLTTGGTGFSPRDITPEVTTEFCERAVPGIPEAMRAKSMEITDKGCLSRATAGIYKSSLIINLPGSEKAATENLATVLSPIRHGIEILLGSGSANCARQTGVITAICVSEQKGTRKHKVDIATLVPDHGIKGDAHAGNWHRQVSLLGTNSFQKAQESMQGHTLQPGDFAENFLVEGIVLYELPIGTRLYIGPALCEVTQIGKECHQDCEIRRLTGDCVMPREGIFVKVLEGGIVRPGDPVETL